MADAKLDALIARGYLAADEREDAEAVQAALEAFLADRLTHYRRIRMTWTTPTLVEICIGLEINGYLPAEF